jgi:EAL domain-containing protein (putative c-di-GMP-specific phosphodiesterase class I)
MGVRSQLLKIADFFLSINITPETLATVGHAQNSLTLMECGHISPRSILIEVSENSLLTSSDIVSENLDILHQAGVRIAVDDFGTGFSNLQRLATLPVDFLKIDRSLIATMEMDETKRVALLTTACAIAKNLGFKIIAEGMEIVAETALLKSLGCEYAQGYYYAKPMPMAELLSFIASNNGSSVVQKLP